MLKELKKPTSVFLAILMLITTLIVLIPPAATAQTEADYLLLPHDQESLDWVSREELLPPGERDRQPGGSDQVLIASDFDIVLEAIPDRALGELTREGFATIRFNDNGFYGLHVPENILIETPN